MSVYVKGQSKREFSWNFDCILETLCKRSFCSLYYPPTRLPFHTHTTNTHTFSLAVFSHFFFLSPPFHTPLLLSLPFTLSCIMNQFKFPFLHCKGTRKKTAALKSGSSDVIPAFPSLNTRWRCSKRGSDKLITSPRWTSQNCPQHSPSRRLG